VRRRIRGGWTRHAEAQIMGPTDEPVK